MANERFTFERRELRKQRADIESLAPALLNALGVNPAQDLPFNEETFFDERPVSRGTSIGQVIEKPLLEDGQPPPEFAGADDRRSNQRPGQIVFTPEQRKAFGRLLSRNPQEGAKAIISVLEKGRDSQIQDFTKQNDLVTKDSIFLQGAKTPLELLGRIRQLASEPNLSPTRKKELKEILSNPDFEGKKLLIEKNILDGKDLKTVFAEETTRRSERAKNLEAQRVEQAKSIEDQRKEGFTASESALERGDFEDVFDKSGKIIGQRDTVTNQFTPIKETDQSFFAKPQFKDFTQDSIKKFFITKKPSDLVAIEKGPSDQILSAFIPFMFGGVDFENPEEMAQAFSRFNLIGAGLKGKSPEEMKKIAEQIKALQPEEEDLEPKEPGTFKQIGDFFKSFFQDDEAALQAIDEVIEDSITKQPRSVPQAAPDIVPLAQIKKQIPAVQVDEFGFAFLPNPKAPEGKQFITDKRGPGGKRIRVK